MRRSLLTGNSQISHLYQKVVHDHKLVSNYHPILLLSLPSKILERIIYNRLLSHLLTNSLLSNSQFGFHPCSSTQEALIAATTSWHQYLDEKQSVAAVFFDLSKPFDSVPHLGILRALTRVGVTGSLHTWFADYLSGRMQHVVLNGHSSQVTKVSSSVPQGYTRTIIILNLYWPAVLHPAFHHLQNPTLHWRHLTSQTYWEGLHFRCRQLSKRHWLSRSMGKLAFKHPKD